MGRGYGISERVERGGRGAEEGDNRAIGDMVYSAVKGRMEGEG